MACPRYSGCLPTGYPQRVGVSGEVSSREWNFREDRVRLTGTSPLSGYDSLR